MRLQTTNEPQPFSLRRVFKGASIYSLGEVLVKASGFFLIPVYTRVLTPADYGIIGYLQVLVQIGATVLAFGFFGAQTRYYYENNADQRSIGEFLFTINVFPVAVALVIGVPVSLLGVRAGWVFGSQGIPFSPLVVLALWTILLNVLSQNAANWFRTRQQFTVGALLQFGKFVSVTVCSLVLVVGFDYGAYGKIAGTFLGSLLFLLASYWAYARNFILRFSRVAFKYAIGFGSAIVIH